MPWSLVKVIQWFHTYTSWKRSLELWSPVSPPQSPPAWYDNHTLGQTVWTSPSTTVIVIITGNTVWTSIRPVEISVCWSCSTSMWRPNTSPRDSRLYTNHIKVVLLNKHKLVSCRDALYNIVPTGLQLYIGGVRVSSKNNWTHTSNSHQ